MEWKENYWGVKPKKTISKCDMCDRMSICKRIYVPHLEPKPWGAYICSECEKSETIKKHLKKYPEVELR
jgi:uncharacterized protein YlaI